MWAYVALNLFLQEYLLLPAWSFLTGVKYTSRCLDFIHISAKPKSQFGHLLFILVISDNVVQNRPSQGAWKLVVPPAALGCYDIVKCVFDLSPSLFI